MGQPRGPILQRGLLGTDWAPPPGFSPSLPLFPAPSLGLLGSPPEGLALLAPEGSGLRFGGGGLCGLAQGRELMDKGSERGPGALLSPPASSPRGSRADAMPPGAHTAGPQGPLSTQQGPDTPTGLLTHSSGSRHTHGEAGESEASLRGNQETRVRSPVCFPEPCDSWEPPGLTSPPFPAFIGGDEQQPRGLPATQRSADGRVHKQNAVALYLGDPPPKQE